MEREQTFTNEKGQTLRIVDDVREVWSNPTCPYSMVGAKLVGRTVVRVEQTIDGLRVSDDYADGFISDMQEKMDKQNEQKERAELARLKAKYEGGPQ